MFENEIKKQKWQVSENVKRIEVPVSGYDSIEQEMGIDILRSGIIDPDNEEIRISCNHQPRITELSKSEFFKLESYEVSTHERHYGYICMVTGMLETNGLTIRRKKHEFSEAEKQRRSEHAKNYFHKRDDKNDDKN